ncbi:MAG TPA: hypothetical protein VIW29_14730 [Polyangiaceae bacterium]
MEPTRPAPEATPSVAASVATEPGASVAAEPGALPAPPGAVKDAPRSRDRVIGLLIVAVAFAICLALSIWAKEKSRPETSEPPGPPTVEGIVGFPSSVDAIATLPAARKLSKRPNLRGIVLEGVQSDGQLDLSEGPARVRYSFQSPAGHGAQPPRDPGTLPKRLTCGKQNVLLRKEGLVAEPDGADYPCPPGGVEALPEPQCSAKDIWRLAKKRKMPRDRLAHIEYYRSKAGPAWRFEIAGTPHHFTVYGDCKRELSASEAHGTVP